MTREQLFARYQALDALAIDYDTALSEPLYTLRMTAYCDYLLVDPHFDYTEFIRLNYGAQFARLPLLCAVNPTPDDNAFDQSSPDWHVRMRIREKHWAKKSVEQFGGPLPMKGQSS